MSLDEFDPPLEPGERDALDALASRLETRRPVPHPAFHGQLRRRLFPAREHVRPMRLRAVAYLASGAALLALAALGVNDTGPLSPRQCSGCAEGLRASAVGLLEGRPHPPERPREYLLHVRQR